MWVQPGGEKPENLDQALSYSSQYYMAHVDWFLRHRDAGIRMLSVILTVEATLTGLVVANRIEPIVQEIASGALVFLAVGLGWYFTVSCKRSYRAALQHAAMTNKVLWAMGLTSPISTTYSFPPLPQDECLFVPDIASSFGNKKTTNEYVEFHIARKGNTYHAARLIIALIAAACFAIGVGTSIALRTGFIIPHQ